MSNTIVNYDGSVVTSPQQVVFPETVEEIQAILRDATRYPSPVRAMGSYHSLTPCVSSNGTVVRMSRMTKIIGIDVAANTFTAQAGLEVIDASKALRAQNVQFMLNIEIGNMTLGSAACCHTKDALDGIEFGQVSSYVTGMKWVAPNGELGEASETTNPELLRRMRSSYGLCGIVYEVTFRIKPIEALHFSYLPRPVEELTQEEVDALLDKSEGIVCWTIGRTSIFQQRQHIQEPGILASLQAAVRRRLWNFTGAHIGHIIDAFIADPKLRDEAQQNSFDAAKLLYGTLHLLGGITLLAPDKTIDYRKTAQVDRYAFTFWAFPKSQWLSTLRAYLDFADAHFKETGFRCNMPLGAYRVHQDTKAILSYTHEQDRFSIDPIHAVTDQAAWRKFLEAFNDFASRRNGTPLLNQSPFIKREHVQAAYGQRWIEFSKWVRATDPQGRMLNPFFADLLAQ
jgi:FAD/FMN-containing dehydrogenase